MSTRIYLVTNRNNDVQQLVRANSQAQAIRHVVKNDYSATVAAQESIVSLLGAGQKVLDAGAELPLDLDPPAES
jgi:hypothetical protein